MNNPLTPPAGRDDLIEVEGVVERVVYKNDSNGYTVCELGASDDDLITLVGIMPFLTEGESIKALGRWELHSSFGRQFKIEYYESSFRQARARCSNISPPER